MTEVEEILSQLKDGDKLIYNLAANVIEQQQKRIEELEKDLKGSNYSYQMAELENKELKAKLKEVEIGNDFNESTIQKSKEMERPVSDITKELNK